MLMREPRETRESKGQLQVVTLILETDTPRRRTLTETYNHIFTPMGELPPARRKRLRAEANALSRAMCRLQPDKHAAHKEKDRGRKRTAAEQKKAVRTLVSTPKEPEWQRHEVEIQVRWPQQHPTIICSHCHD